MRCDLLIIGSSFSGSILAWTLAKLGRKVVMIDRGSHPRFAIGESSTPTADFLIEDIANRWGVHELLPLARWGSWQRTYPSIIAGKKRGFSYFSHRENLPFSDTEDHDRSLLVTASESDEVSDTHWMRSDVDFFLSRQAEKAEVTLLEHVELRRLTRYQQVWKVLLNHHDESLEIETPFVIDATGSGGVIADVEKLSRLDHQLQTRTGALFAHFAGLHSWDEILPTLGCSIDRDPFHSDDAAQHHVFSDGWSWILRFNDGTASVGIVRPSELWDQEKLRHSPEERKATWNRMLSLYPSYGRMFTHATVIRPEGGLQFAPRLSRLWSQAAGDGWAMLPTTAGFVDPLHSSGIAHALSGVHRMISLFADREYPSSEQLEHYSQSIIDEVRFVDSIVAACYAALPDFDLFRAACSFYFLAAIQFETHCMTMRQRNDSAASWWRHGFLMADSTDFRRTLDSLSSKLIARREENSHLADPNAAKIFLDEIRRSIAPWNNVNLLDEAFRHRHARTAAQK